MRSTSHAPPTPITSPMPQPIRDSVSASIRNCHKISLRRAPIAMRMPISRVRSVTDTSMMFMMPMPPTTKEIAAIAPSSILMTRVVEASASAIAVRLRTVKSSSCPIPMR
jgi:hypothetical protein